MKVEKLPIREKDNSAVVRMTPNNQITLLQNGEAYFPEIEAAFDRAVHEIYLDYRLLHYASHALYGGFLGAGIEIYEYHQSMMHAKVAVIDEHWATVGSSNLDPLSLLLSLEANVVVDDENFAGELKHSLEQAIKAGARRISDNKWGARTPLRMRLISWLSYGVVRFMTGMAGYAPGDQSDHV